MDRIPHQRIVGEQRVVEMERAAVERAVAALGRDQPVGRDSQQPFGLVGVEGDAMLAARLAERQRPGERRRSEEHTSELQALMRISYAVFCFKKKTTTQK